MFQDSNYIPFDLYTGKHKSEDLDVIADRMGIPADTPNRHEIVKEQMRKIATQNNTLWMLTAGITPAMAGLISCALEEPISSGLAHYRNNKNNAQINELHNSLQQMSAKLESLKETELSKEVFKILNKYSKEDVLPEEEFQHITKLITENLDTATRNNLTDELRSIFETAANESERFALFNDEIIEETINASKKGLKARKDRVNKILPSIEDVRKALLEVVKDVDFSKDVRLEASNIEDFKLALEKIIDKKIDKDPQGQ